MQFRYNADRTRAGDVLIGRNRFGFTIQFSPTRRIALLMIDTTMGQEIDFANARPATGATINLEATVRPTDHLSLNVINNTRWLNVEQGTLSGRLFNQSVVRIRGTYTFTARMFVRVIGQDVSTTRNPALYASDVSAKAGSLTGSVLFAYKLNWQSVMFIGYGDDRELSDQQRFAPQSRQLFVKLSYAFQR
jgi:hypothetical protein